jgi:hypothetical protein
VGAAGNCSHFLPEWENGGDVKDGVVGEVAPRVGRPVASTTASKMKARGKPKGGENSERVDFPPPELIPPPSTSLYISRINTYPQKISLKGRNQTTSKRKRGKKYLKQHGLQQTSEFGRVRGTSITIACFLSIKKIHFLHHCCFTFRFFFVAVGVKR